MSIDKFLKFFVPKDRSFYPLFIENARILVRAAELLKELMSSDITQHQRLHMEIKEVEHSGDQITDQTYEQLNKSFITPFDREDIHELAAHIDDVIDSINGVSQKIHLYKPKKMLPVYKQMAKMVYDAAMEIQICIHCLNDAAANKKEITKCCNNVKVIEHKVDDIYYEAVSHLFENENDPAELLKTNKILEVLERIVDEEEDVADTIKSILIKMA